MSYNAPLPQISSTLTHVAQLDQLADTGAFPNFDGDLVAPILEEANKLARDVLAPLNAMPAGSPWWRAINDRLLRDGCEAVARSGGRGAVVFSDTVMDVLC